MLGFKGTRIWPLNPKAMDAKNDPSIIYTLQNQAREEEKLKQEDGGQNIQLKKSSSTQVPQQKLQLMVYLKINLGIL